MVNTLFIFKYGIYFIFLVYLYIGRKLSYRLFKAFKTLVWTISIVLFILMIAIIFLGYEHSPKWYKLNNSYYINSNYILLLHDIITNLT